MGWLVPAMERGKIVVDCAKPGGSFQHGTGCTCVRSDHAVPANARQ